jgi:choline-sulfatase
MTFDAAYCASPLCAPSRAAMLTGRRSSDIGVFDNAAELPASIPTLAHHLRAAGYRTCLSGKMHFVGPDQLHGFERRLTTDVYPAGLDWTPDWTRPLADLLPWYHTMESVLTPARTVASMQTDYDDEVAFHAVRYIHELARRSVEQPFLLVVSFTNPHDPWEIPAPYWDRYDAAAIDLPDVRQIPLADADPHSRRLRIMAGIDEVPLSEDQIRAARHGYYAAISYVDERIGTVLAALRATGLDPNTVILFTADHGEFLGERGLWYKMSFFEPSSRVPLVIRVPGVEGGRRVTEPVSQLDVLPTLLSLSGAAGDFRLEGESLVARLTGQPCEPHKPVIAEYLAEGVQAPAAMIRHGDYKLIVCRDDPDQLYDLGSDPLEVTNLAESPAHADTVRRLRAALRREIDLAAIETRVLASQQERHLVAESLRRGEITPWDYQPYVDAATQYVRQHTDLYELQRRARLEGG